MRIEGRETTGCSGRELRVPSRSGGGPERLRRVGAPRVQERRAGRAARAQGSPAGARPGAAASSWDSVAPGAHLGVRNAAGSRRSSTPGTQLVSSVQSACSPQLQPVEKREKSQVSRRLGR